MTKKVAILLSHPIQYFAPFFREVTKTEEIDFTVFFCSRKGLLPYRDIEFGKTIQWDIPLTEGYQYVFLNNFSRNEESKGFFSLINPGIYKELKKGKFDLVWIFGHAYFTMVFGLLAAKILGIKAACYGDSNLTKLKNRNSFIIHHIRRPLFILYYKLYNYFFVIGTRNREYYLYHNVPKDKMCWIPYSVDNAFFLGKRKDLIAQNKNLLRSVNLPENKNVILTASKFTKGKRVMDLLKAFHKISLDYKEAILILVGDGPEKEKLQKYVEENAVQNVYFTGFKNQSELPAYYYLADIYCFPGENESWGLAINEAMCFENPVISTKEIGAVADLVQEGVNGYTYDTGDIDQLSNLILLLLKDEVRRKEMGRKSLKIIRGWNYTVDIEGIQKAIF